FTDQVTLITRAYSVNAYGEGQITETSSTITAVVQGPSTETLTRLPEAARLSDAIEVWYQGALTAESSGGYADVIVWHGKRFQVKTVTEDFSSWGRGYTHAICLLEPVNNA